MTDLTKDELIAKVLKIADGERPLCVVGFVLLEHANGARSTRSFAQLLAPGEVELGELMQGLDYIANDLEENTITSSSANLPQA